MPPENVQATLPPHAAAGTVPQAGPPEPPHQQAYPPPGDMPQASVPAAEIASHPLPPDDDTAPDPAAAAVAAATASDKSRFWDQGAVIRPGPGRTYTRIVRWMRLLLPLIALCVVGVLIAWPRMEEAMAPVAREAAAVPAAARNEVLNPRYESLDNSGQPFVITADRAVQSLKDPDLVLLDRPAASLTLGNGRVLSGRAENGTYRQAEEQLWLEGDVRLSQDDGYEMTMEKLLISLKTQQAWSDRPVSGQGPAGTLAASGVQLDNGNGKLIFTGPARLVLTGIKGP